MARNFFIDTEFVQNGTSIELVSLGAIAPDGRELYLEADWIDWGKFYSQPFLVKEVLPGLKLDDLKTKEQWREEIRIFFGRKFRPWFWCGAYDWVAITQLYGDFQALPPAFPFAYDELHTLWREAGSPMDMPSMKDERERHNALADAREVKMRYEWLKSRNYRLSGKSSDE